MTELESLYAFADECGHDVDFMMMHRAESMSIELTKERSAICIDPTKIDGPRDEKMKLSHELGHCEKHAFYHPYSPFETVERCEHKAMTWQIERLIPKAALDTARKKHMVDLWELSEYFDVPEWFMSAVIRHYYPR